MCLQQEGFLCFFGCALSLPRLEWGVPERGSYTYNLLYFSQLAMSFMFMLVTEFEGFDRHSIEYVDE